MKASPPTIVIGAQSLPPTLKQRLQHWVQQEIIDDDPWDPLSEAEAVLMTRLKLRELLGVQGISEHRWNRRSPSV